VIAALGQSEVNEAAKNLAMLELAPMNAEIAYGFYKKPVEVIAKEIHYEPLPGEVRAVVIAAWQRGGSLPRAVVEQIAPAADSIVSKLPSVVGT
jgi:hypothetical protein